MKLIERSNLFVFFFHLYNFNDPSGLVPNLNEKGMKEIVPSKERGLNHLVLLVTFSILSLLPSLAFKLLDLNISSFNSKF